MMRSASLIGFCCADADGFFEPANAFFFDAAAKTFLGFEELSDIEIGLGAVDDEVDCLVDAAVTGEEGAEDADCSTGEAD